MPSSLPDDATALFEAGPHRATPGELLRLQHAFERMGTDLWGASPPGRTWTAPTTRCSSKLGMLPDFPLRLLSPYRGFTDDDYRALPRFLQADYADWLEPRHARSPA